MPELPGGGAEKVLIDILCRFDYRKYNVTMLLMQKTGVYLLAVPPEVKVLSLFKHNKKLPNFTYYRRLRKTIRRLLVLLELPLFARYDTIVSFLEGETLFYHSLIAFKAKRNITWVHTDLKQYHWSRTFFWDDNEEKSAYLKMDAVVCVSNKAKSSLSSLFPELTGLKTIYNIIDTEQIRDKARQAIDIVKPDGFLLCASGRLVNQKRFDRFIDVINLLHERGHNVHGWILGTGDLKDSLEHKAAKSGLVKLLGFKQNPMPYMYMADALMITSDVEGFSLVCAEALSLGKPVVSTKCTGPEELLKGDAGILTDFSVESMANAVERLIINPEIRKKYEAAALARANMFNPNDTMSQIYAVIDGNV